MIDDVEFDVFDVDLKLYFEWCVGVFVRCVFVCDD